MFENSGILLMDYLRNYFSSLLLEKRNHLGIHLLTENIETHEIGALWDMNKFNLGFSECYQS